MAQILKLKDADQTLRDLVASFRGKSEECIIQDDDNQTIAALLPAQEYQRYQSYLNRREQNFGVIDRIREKMKGFDPDKIQADIDRAVDEVKAKSRPKRQAT